MYIPKIKQKAKAKHPVILVSRYALRFLSWITGGVDLNYDARTTTVGRVIYIGTRWAERDAAHQAAEIAHETEHVNQWRRWWILYPISYMLSVWSIPLAILPAVLSLSWIWGIVGAVVGCLIPGPSLRAYWEYRAFQRTIEILYAQGVIPDLPEQKWLIAQIYATTICGKAYYWAGMWMFGIIQYRLWQWTRTL